MTDRCPECGQTVPDKHHLIDHLSDAHRLFEWAVAGRPAPMEVE